MGSGYIGKILMVNLNDGTIQDEVIPKSVYESYLSGMGLGAYVLYHRIPANADPLGPDNILGFVSGLLTGTGSLFTGRWMALGKSPLTGGWGEANCGGNLSPAIKRSGYDGIFITGISQTPVYIAVENGKAELRDAFDLWGKDAIETEDILIRRSGSKKKPAVACIGPAGENRSLIAGISNDRGRMAARSGLGAVMGAKRLKAIVLSGNQPITVHDKERIRALSKECAKWVQAQPKFISGKWLGRMGSLMGKLPFQTASDGNLFKILLKKWGTVGLNQMAIEIGDSPIKNWKGSNKDFGLKQSESINPDVFKHRQISRYYCYSCPLGCGGICAVPDRAHGNETVTMHKPEYETVLSLGGLLMNSDIDAIFQLNEQLNRAGMDTISAGGVMAFAMECYETGILTQADTGGLDLKWGNSEAITALVDKMIRREGIGDLLADGVKAAAQKIGRNSDIYAIHSGGQELPMHDGRNDPGFALHYSVEPAPGRHSSGSQMYYELYRLWTKIKSLPKAKLIYRKSQKYVPDTEKAVQSVACSKFVNVVNGAGACLFGMMLGVDRVPLFEWLNAATGWDYSPQAYMEMGERIQTLRQMFNLKHGVDPKQNRPNDRALGIVPMKKGANKGRTVAIETLRADYWKLMGWNPETGRPETETLKRLNLNE